MDPGSAMTFVAVIHCDVQDTLPDEMYTVVDTSKARLRMKFLVPKPCFYRFSATPAL